MHISSAVLALAIALPIAVAASVPEFFLIKTAVVAGQPSSKSKYGGLFMSTAELARLDPLFSPESEGGAFFSLDSTDAPPHDGKNYGSLKYNNTRGGPVFRAAVQYNYAEDASWEPVTFIPNKGIDNIYQYGWYLKGSNLMWTNAYNTSDSNRFEGWIVCDWYYGVPQLFALTGFSSTLPSSCAQVTLGIVPFNGGS